MAKPKANSQVNTMKSEEYVQDSSSDSGSNSSGNLEQTDSKAQQESKSKVSSRQLGEISEDSDSETSSSASTSRSSSPAKRKAEVPLTAKIISKKSKKSQNEVSISNRKPLAAPVGYSGVNLDVSDYVSDSGSMFADLNGKQVWHITAPASVPITDVMSLDIEAALRGEPILIHEGTNYSMYATASTGETLLLPREADSNYTKSNVDVAKNLHLREMAANLPSKNAPASALDTGTEQAQDDIASVKPQFFAVVEGTIKAHREQPTGLLMRYQPYGNTATGKGPYSLPHPALDIDKENDARVQSALQMPSDDDESTSIVQTPKKSKKGEHSKHGKKSRKQDNSEKDAMDIDMVQHEIVSNDPSKFKSKLDSEKRRKKQPKAEA